VIVVPDSIGFEQAAAFPVQVLIAWHMLHTSHQTGPGQTVLVHSAAGGVGIVAVQIAKAAGARVIGTVSSASKAALIKEYGADDAINYATDDFAAEANRLTGGLGVDLILDAVGATHVGQGSDVSRSVRNRGVVQADRGGKLKHGVAPNRRASWC
jgi:NADPH:quinone reductase